MHTKLGARIEPLTPELVEEFRKLPALPGEREIRPSRVARQRQWIAARLYTGVEWATVRDKSTGTVYRANGQHSSAVLASLDGLRFPTRPDGSPLPAIIAEYEMDDVAVDGLKVFDCFDNPVSSRSNSDRMTMVKAAYADIKHLKPGFLIKVVNAVEEYRHAKLPNHDPVDARYRGEELLQDPEVRAFALWLSQYAVCENHDFINRIKAMAVAFENWLEDRDEAIAFWAAVFNEDDADATSASRMMADELKAMRVRAKKGERLRVAASRAWKRHLGTIRKKAA